ncbi:MAG: hypothetical protein HZB91_10675 [Elusimicrobia bacterium]|nr:hypothetical protein [Elusimicrobiota bacterium]
MTLNPYAEDPQSSPPGVYEVTDSGMSFVEKTAPPQALPRKPMFGSILLQLSLLGALLAYFLNGQGWYVSVEGYFEARAKARMIEPYRSWALAHPQSYEDVAASGSGFMGKAVLWEFAVDSSSEPVSCYCEGDPMKKVAWARGEAAVREKAAGGMQVKALARIEGTREDLPLLSLLE